MLLGGPTDVATPALLLDLRALEANIASLHGALAGQAHIRPHAKSHKCVEIARRQLAAGAVGVTVATAGEAVALAAAEPPEILVANEIVDPPAIAALVRCAATTDVIVAVDDPDAVRALGAAAAAAGRELGVLIDVDIGMGRGGVRSVAEAREVAGHVERTPGVRLRGVMGYEGHTVLERDPVRRAAAATAATNELAGVAAALRADGVAVDIVSAGGTNTALVTGAHPAVTEVQAGTYAVMDRAYAPFSPTLSPVLSLVGTVVSRHDRRVVLDVGTKALALIDLAPPAVPGGLRLTDVHEEHMLLDADGDPPALGTQVEIGVPYCGGTVSLHDRFHVVRDGAIAERWTIHRDRGA